MSRTTSHTGLIVSACLAAALVALGLGHDGASPGVDVGAPFITSTTPPAPSTSAITPPPSTSTTPTSPSSTAEAPPTTAVGGERDDDLDMDPVALFGAPRETILTFKGGGRAGFISTCPFVTSGPIDPIVYPGSTVDSHEHDFFGNQTTDEDTTTESLIGGTTSCSHADDLSAYWTPSVLEGGRPVAVEGTSMYYFTDRVRDPDSMEPMPVGLRMIAGDAFATEPQADDIGWFEEHRRAKNNTRGERQMINAGRGDQVTVRVNFPQCWNGTQLDSPDHKSHMAYAVDGQCPDTHPVLFPQLSMFVRYDADGGDDFALSSGPWYTLHADFWNAWHPEALEGLVDDCRVRHCDRVKTG